MNATCKDASAALEDKDSMNAIDDSNSKILLNLDQVEDIESSGLGTIVSAMKHLGDGRKINLRAYPNR